MTSFLYIDGSAGASGDMILAALVDLGFPLRKLQKTLDLLPVRIEVSEKKVNRNGLSATLVEPRFPKNQKLRNLTEALSFLERSKLPKETKDSVSRIFVKLAEAESKVHGKSKQTLHFHELGSLDTIFDLVGVVSALKHLEIGEIHVGPLNLGGGTVKTAHGILPVPVPAVPLLLEGFYVYSSSAQTELVTPTGAAVLSMLGRPVSSLPKMQLEKIGCGAGQKVLPFPNILRAFLGSTIHRLGP